MTQQDFFAQALIERGYREIPATSRKYRVFVKDGQSRLYLGRAGALRAGPSITTSIPVSDAAKKRLLAEGEAATSPEAQLQRILQHI